MQRIIVETEEIDAIPVITVASDNAKKLPLVLFIHGFAGDRSQGMQLGYWLARSGFFYAALDADMHGSRLDKRLAAGRASQASPYPPGSRLDALSLMFQAFPKTLEDVDSLISHFSRDSRVEHSKVGVCGFSMGGFMTYYMAALSFRVRAAVAIAGAPSFSSYWHDAIRAARRKAADAAVLDQLDGIIRRDTLFIDGMDPWNALLSMEPKPLLMIQGNADAVVPRRYAVNLHKALKPKYASCPDWLGLNSHPTDHRMTAEMVRQTCDWFGRFL